MYNKDWHLIATAVKTRSVLQIRTHGQKYFTKLAKGEVFPLEVYINSLCLCTVGYQLQQKYSSSPDRTESIQLQQKYSSTPDRKHSSASAPCSCITVLLGVVVGCCCWLLLSESACPTSATLHAQRAVRQVFCDGILRYSRKADIHPYGWPPPPTFFSSVFFCFFPLLLTHAHSRTEACTTSLPRRRRLRRRCPRFHLSFKAAEK